MGLAEQALKLSAEVATCKAPGEVEDLLKQLHELLFQSSGSASEALTTVTSLLEQVNFKSARRDAAGKPLRKKASPVSEELVVLESVLLLARLFLGCARESAVSNPTGSLSAHDLKRLDTLVLPKLFASTRVSATHLRDLALRQPWTWFSEAAAKSSSFDELLSPDLQDFLQSLKTNYHCDFLPVCKGPSSSAANAASPPPAEASSSLNCPSWDAGVRQAPPPLSATAPQRWVPRSRAETGVASANPATGVKTTHGIPAYLLTRRAPPRAVPQDREPVVPRHEGIRAAVVDPRYEERGKPEKSPSPAHPRMSDSEDSNSMLALETPVRRHRRLDPLLCIPPSPERPHVEIHPPP